VRFIEHGPILPNELLFAQDEGRVVFFCGSGVSLAKAGLPNFAGLAERVLRQLGAQDSSDAKKVYDAARRLEAESGVQGLLSADRIFGLLRRSFDIRDIDRAVAQSLVPKRNPPLSAHKTMLRLGRQQNGLTRLVTTNFDRLFEACDSTLKPVTRSSLPRIQFVGDDWGIVHLHGRVTPDYSGPDRDGFVLSSAEFGDAYLAQGWARDFVRDILDRYIAVFVGYSADDPPMRYLLEGLQQSDGPRHKIYAFQPGPNDEAVAQWDEKGVEAIIYDPSNGYEKLWRTLDAWADRNADPEAWKAKIFAMARKGPAKLAPHQRGMLAHIVSSKSGALIFRKQDPPIPAEWLCVFDPLVRFGEPLPAGGRLTRGDIIDPYTRYSLDDDAPPRGKNEELSNTQPVPVGAWNAFAINEEDRHVTNDRQLAGVCGRAASDVPILPQRLSALGDWIGAASHEPATTWWAAQKNTLHPEIIRSIKHRHKRPRAKKATKVVRDAWRLIFELYATQGSDDFAEYDLNDEIKDDGWDSTVVRRYAKLFAPKLKRERLYASSTPPLGRGRIVRSSLIQSSIEYSERISAIEVPDKFLSEVINAQRINIESAIDLEQERSGFLDLCAIEPEADSEDQQFSRTYRISGYVIHFTQLFRRLVKLNAAAAKAEYRKWRGSDEVFKRLRFWAASFEEVASAEEFAAEILSLSRKSFWNFRSQRDLLLALAKRWPGLSVSDRKKIEKKIMAGPVRRRSVPAEEHERRSAHVRLNWLHWLAANGYDLTLDLEAVTETLRAKTPDWRPEYAERAAESRDGRGGQIQARSSRFPCRKLLNTRKASRAGAMRSWSTSNRLRALAAMRLRRQSAPCRWR